MKLWMILALSCSFEAFGAQTAKVLVVKGKATKLLPGGMQASPVKRGEKVPEDTSIVTGKKSFVRIKFADKSTMNVAANSKVLVSKLPKKKANVVNLLTGMIKAEVNKDIKKATKNKMIVKTGSAIMGVRGTKFQSTYNPSNKTTSLVTVEGKVAMAKVKETPADKVAEVTADPSTEVEVLEQKLEASAEVVEVPAGRYAGVAEKAVKPSVPVKIAPKQYDALAKSMGSKKKAKDVMKTTDADPNPEGFLDESTGDFAPKAGGYVDAKTGLYVAPTADSVLDNKTGTFKAKKKIGTVSKTGEYIPPKGVKLDAKKGFVVDNKELAKVASTEDKEALKKTVANLNQGVKKQIKVNKLQTERKKSWMQKYLPKNHIVSVEISPYSESLSVENKASSSEAQFYTKSASRVLLTWKQIWSSKVRTRLIMGGIDYQLDDEDIEVNDEFSDDGGQYFSMGFEYQLKDKWALTLALTDRDQYFVRPDGQDENGDDRVSLESRTLNSFDVGFIYAPGKNWRGIDLSYYGALHLIGESELPSENGGDDGDFFSFVAGVDGTYQYKKKWFLVGKLWYAHENAENDTFAYSRRGFGTTLKAVWDI